MNCINLLGRYITIALSLLFVVATVPYGFGQTSISFNQSFSPSTIGPGSTTALTFTITNNTSNTTFKDLAFSNTFPAQLLIASPSNAVTDCKDGIISATEGGSSISLSNGRLGGNSSCIVTVHVTGNVSGTYNNTTGQLSSNQGNHGTSTASLTVDADRPGFSKSFTPSTISPGNSSKLVFTIDNSSSSLDITQLNFFDQLPGNLVVASPSNTSTTCALGNGTFSAAPGTNTISASIFNSQVVAAGASCVFEVDVTSASSGIFSNVTSDLETQANFSNQPRSSGFATAILNVPNQVLTKSFINDPVAPGAPVILNFKINNPDNLFSGRPGFGDYTNVAFSDNLEAVLPGTNDLLLTSVLSNTCGGAVSGINTGNLSFSGGTVLIGQSCVISVSLSPANTTPIGSYSSTSAAITYDVGGDGVTGNAASDILTLRSDPILTKEFLSAGTLTPDPVVAGGDDVVMRFTVKNTSLGFSATDVTFLDDLTKILPFPIIASIPATPCGAGSSGAIITIATERQGFLLSGGTLPPDGQCSFDVTLTLPTDITQGVYTNTTEEITANINGQQVTGKPASDELLVATAPSLVKVFGQNQVAPGGTVDLTFILDHGNNAPGPASNITFNDDLNTMFPGLSTTGVLNTGTCNGTLNETSGLLSYSGGSMAIGEICSFTVTLDVPGSAPSGQFTNVTSDVTGNVTVGNAVVAVTNAPSSDILEVLSLTVSKEFIDDPVVPGNDVTLRFSVKNETNQSLTNVMFTDDLTKVLSGLIASSLPANGFCGAGSAITGTTNLSVTGVNLGANASCSFDVVLSVPGGAALAEYTNTTSVISADVGGNAVTAPPASDVLVVADAPRLLTISKSFADGNVNSGDQVVLNFNISYLGTPSATNISFTDNLGAVLSGLTAVTFPPNGFCGPGSSITGSSVLTMSGGSLAAPNSSCAFSVTLQTPSAAAAGDYLNTTSVITADSGVEGNAASDILTLRGPVVHDPPIAVIMAPDTVVCGLSSGIMVPFSGAGSSTFNPPLLSYTWTENGNILATGINPNILLGVGDHIITLTVTDAFGAGSSSMAITIIEDTTDPIITSCPGPVSVSADAGICTASNVSLGSSSATDNCDTSVDITNDAPSVFPIGSTTVTWTATDDNNNTATCTQTVTVTDDEAPVITLKSGATLWPPNGKYVNFDMDDIVASVIDNCDGAIDLSNVAITSGTSDEPENGSGDGNTVDDIDIAGDCNSVQVRSERKGNGNGRVYTIHLEVSDTNGNTELAAFIITVPNSQNGSPAVDDGPVYTETCGSSLRDEPTKSVSLKHIIVPNPANDEIFIDLQSFKTGVVNIEIYNIQGAKMIQRVITINDAKNHRINLSDLKDGTYHLIAIQGADRIHSTFIKVH